MDCANGVGYAALKKLCAILEAQPAGAAFQLRPVNGGEGQLNEACGADFVQKERARPANFASAPDGSRCVALFPAAARQPCASAARVDQDGALMNVRMPQRMVLCCRCASFDGDADRVVYFSPTADRVELYDGDR